MEIKKIAENIYEIEKHGNMKVPARLFASESLFEKIKLDKTLEQCYVLTMSCYLTNKNSSKEAYQCCNQGIISKNV